MLALFALIERVLWMVVALAFVGWVLFLWMLGDDKLDGDGK